MNIKHVFLIWISIFLFSSHLSGESFDLTRHGLRIEIKTPTYHQYELKQTEDGWQALLVLDV